MNFNLRESPTVIGVEDQSLVVQFAHVAKVNDVWQNQTYFSECRDFMGDAIYATEINEAVDIYGFRYDPKENPLRTDRCSIGIRFPDKETQQQFSTNLPMLIKLGIKPSFVSVDYDKLITILSFNKIWLKTTFGVSYLTFLLKCLCYELDPAQDLIDQIEVKTFTYEDSWTGEKTQRKVKEAGYIQNIKDDLKKLPAVVVKLLMAMPDSHGILEGKVATYNVHNSTGFYSSLRWKGTMAYKLFEELTK